MQHIKVQLFPNPKLGQLTLTKDSNDLSQHLRIKVGDGGVQGSKDLLLQCVCYKRLFVMGKILCGHLVGSEQ